MSVELLPASLRAPAIGDGSFPAGTPIAVPGAAGTVAVEALARGDAVLTLAGPVAVRHAERRRVEPQATGPDAPLRARLMPVRVRAGAFGEGQPAADLLLPPEGLVHVIDAAAPLGVLVPVGALVNGETIRREPVERAGEWVRLELERPGVVIAAGLLVAARDDAAAPPAAPILAPGPMMAALRQRLVPVAAAAPEVVAAPEPAPEAEPEAVAEAAPVAMAEPVEESAAEAAPEANSGEDSGPVSEAVEEAVEPVEPAEIAPAGEEAPAVAVLQAMVRGEALELLEGSGATLWNFMLPEGTAIVRLVSPRGLPANISGAEREGSRRFGVAVRRVLVDDAPVPLDGPAIGDGFHNMETVAGESWRWTNGAAVLHLPPSPAKRLLTVEITDWHRMLQPE